MQEVHESASVISRSRVEFLFDGIFAIAMTLLVLDLHIPEIAHRNSVQELASELRHDLPTFGSYLLSFVVLGVFWYRHNHAFRFIRRITGAMLVLHLLQMACAAFFPFCASLIGRYPTNPLSLVFYSACIATYVWAGLLNWLVASRTDSLDEHFARETYRAMRNRQLRGCFAVSMAVGLSIFHLFVY